MSAGNILLVLAALAILSVFIVQAHGNILASTEMVVQGQVALTAASLAQGLMEESQVRAFDEVVLDGAPASESYLTHPMALGPEGAEAWPAFDDIDDYEGLSRVEIRNGIDFLVTGSCGYVTGNAPDQIVQTQTYYKRLQISVDSSYLANPIVVSQIVSYF